MTDQNILEPIAEERKASQGNQGSDDSEVKLPPSQIDMLDSGDSSYKQPVKAELQDLIQVKIREKLRTKLNEEKNESLPWFHWSWVYQFCFSILLLVLSAITDPYSIESGSLFLLFILHAISYWVYRVTDQPIDMLSDMRYSSKATMPRIVFKWLFLVVVLGWTIFTIVGRVLLDYYEGQKKVDFELTVKYVMPEIQSWWVFIKLFLLILAATSLFIVQYYEESFAKSYNIILRKTYEEIYHRATQDDVLLQSSQVQRCVQILKDYKMSQEFLASIQLILLVLISAVYYSVFTIIYLILAIVMILVVALSKPQQDQTYRSFSSSLSAYCLIYLLIIDLLWDYTAKTMNINNGFNYQSLMISTPSVIAFGFKIVLFIFECFKQCYTYDFSVIYDQLKDKYVNVDSSKLPGAKRLPKAVQSKDEDNLLHLPISNLSEHDEIQKKNQRIKHSYIKHFKKSYSYFTRLLQPISVFMAAIFQTVFLLGHGSLLAIILLAIAFFGFFVEMDSNTDGWKFYRWVSQIILVIELIYVVAQFTINVFQIGDLFVAKNNLTLYIGLGSELQTGVSSSDSLIYDSIFPFTASLVQLFFISVYIRYMGKPKFIVKSNKDLSQDVPAEQDDEMLTVFINDDGQTSSARSDIRSFRSGGSRSSKRGRKNKKKYQGSDLHMYLIKEEAHEEDDEDHEHVVIDKDPDASEKNDDKKSQEESSEEDDKTENTSKHRKRADPSQDFTFRGYFRQFFYKAYMSCYSFFDQLVDILIVHVNKVTLLAVFVVSIIRPTVVNFVLFLMFIILLLIPYQHEKTYLRVTIAINSIAILLIFIIDELVERNYHKYRVWALYCVGIQYEQENTQVNRPFKMKFMPYVLLEIFLVLCVYVISTDRYQKFIKLYSEQFDEEKQAIKRKQDEIRQKLGQNFAKFVKSPSLKSLSNKSPKPVKKDDQEEDDSQKEGGRPEDPLGLEGGGYTESNDEEDPTKSNLLRKQEGSLLYDPLAKWILQESLSLIIIFLFVEISILPLSVMNVILLVLMTIIVSKILYSDTKYNTLQSLRLTLQILNIFTIVYIFTKYLFAFTDYTNNIELKQQIENGSPTEREKAIKLLQQKNEANDLDLILQKLFGFQKTLNIQTLGLKLLNLAIILSLTNVILMTLSHRECAKILEDEELSPRQALIEKFNYWRESWQWWVYAKTYFLFIVALILPLTIIVLAFSWYPFISLNVPSVLYLTVLLILFACAISSSFKYIHAAIGVLSQIMLVVVYCAYFCFLEIVPDVQTKMSKITFEVLTGVIDNGKVTLFEDKVFLIILLPLFVTIMLCIWLTGLNQWLSKQRVLVNPDHHVWDQLEKFYKRHEPTEVEETLVTEPSGIESVIEKESDEKEKNLVTVLLKNLRETDEDTLKLCNGDQKQVDALIEQLEGADIDDDRLLPQIDDDEEEDKLFKQLELFCVELIESEGPLRQCYIVKNSFWIKYVAHFNSVNLVVYFGIYAILNKMNVLALIQWACISWLLRVKFRPNVFKKSRYQDYTQKYNRKAQYDSISSAATVLAVSVQIGVISLIMLLQLSTGVYSSLEFGQQDQFQRQLSQSFCVQQNTSFDEEYDDNGNIYQTASPLTQAGSQYNKECAKDWSYYLLSLNTEFEDGASEVRDGQRAIMNQVIIDLFFLLSSYLLLLVASGKIKLIESQKSEPPVIEDKHDFVISDDLIHDENQSFGNQMQRFLKTCFFVYFPYFLIIFLLVAACTLNGIAVSDLASAIYLWFALIFIVRCRELFINHNKEIQQLRIFNRIVITLMLLYQMPLFICPSAVDINGFTDPDYITTEDCALISHQQASDPNGVGAKKEAKSSRMQLYIIMMHSIGLHKENRVNIIYVFLFLFTEIQQQAFIHPYYREYVLKHLTIETDSVSKVRGFLFTERFHLTKKWAYRAIKEEIIILHDMLTRLHKKVQSSYFLKNLRSFEDEENEKLLSSKDEEEKNPEEESKDSQKQVEKFMEDNSTKIDRIAIDNLEPNKPVVPRKVLFTELKIRLQKEVEEGKELKEIDLPTFVKDLIGEKLLNYVQAKHRIDLYNTEGLGLSLALAPNLRAGIADLEGESQDAKSNTEDSYLYQAEINNDNESMSSDARTTEKYVKSFKEYKMSRGILWKKLYNEYHYHIDHHSEHANSFIHNDDKISSSTFISDHKDFTPTTEGLKMDDEKFEELVKDKSFCEAVSLRFRYFLWVNFIDHILLIKMRVKKDKVHGHQFIMKKPEVQDYGLLSLLQASILSISQFIVFIAVAVNFMLNSNLISCFIVLTNMGYMILENPIAPTTFWTFMMGFLLVVISAKFLYQLPVFCGTPEYTFYSDICSSTELPQEQLASRSDYLIGIHKFSGSASFPKNQGLFFGILADTLLLIAYLIHKEYLSKIGAWEFVQQEPSIYQSPSFNAKASNVQDEDPRNANEQIGAMAEHHYDTYQREHSAWYYKLGKFFYDIAVSIGNFFLRLLPQYMDRKQNNLDARKNQERPYMTHKMKRVKPGTNYFSQIFFILLVIEFYTLIFWKNFAAEEKPGSKKAKQVSADLDNFSTYQVISLLLILILILFERMLNRMRYTDDRDIQGKRQHIAQDGKSRRLSRVGIKHTLTIKLIIYYILLVTIHVLLGFYLPWMQLAPMYQNIWLSVYYVFWFLYFYYSALQIREGFPSSPYKQPFQKYTMINDYSFKVYKAIPFLWEMKVIIDWTVSSTCLDLYQWFKLDDAYNGLFQNVIQNEYRAELPEFAQRSFFEKLFMGFCFALIVIIIILCPIFLFSGINPIMSANPVKTGSLQISLELMSTGNTYNIFTTQANHIQPLTEIDDENWRLYFEPDSRKVQKDDMQKIQFNVYSDDVWTISPPSLRRFLSDFHETTKDKPEDFDVIKFKSELTFQREFPVGKEKSVGKREIVLKKKDVEPVIAIIEKQTMKEQKSVMMAQMDDSLLQLGDYNYYDQEEDGPQMNPQLYLGQLLGKSRDYEYQPFNQYPYMFNPMQQYQEFGATTAPEPQQEAQPNKVDNVLNNIMENYVPEQQPVQLNLTVKEPEAIVTKKMVQPKEEIPAQPQVNHAQHKQENTTIIEVPRPEKNIQETQNQTYQDQDFSDSFIKPSEILPILAKANAAVPAQEKDNNKTVTIEKTEVQEDKPTEKKKEVTRTIKNSHALIEVQDAFPKLIHLDANDKAEPLDVTPTQNKTTLYTSINLQVNRQGSSIYFWTFSLGSESRGNSYLKDTPGVFNSKLTEHEIQTENEAEKERRKTAKSDRKSRDIARQEMQKKRISKAEQNLVILVYNDHVIGSLFGSALNISVLGLYATLVITFGRLIRTVFDHMSQRVIYEELPNTQQLFEICEGIYIAQAEGDLVREKQLYDLLILLLRSPEAMIRITGTNIKHIEGEEGVTTDKDSSQPPDDESKLDGSVDKSEKPKKD